MSVQIHDFVHLEKKKLKGSFQKQIHIGCRWCVGKPWLPYLLGDATKSGAQEAHPTHCPLTELGRGFTAPPEISSNPNHQREPDQIIY